MSHYLMEGQLKVKQQRQLKSKSKHHHIRSNMEVAQTRQWFLMGRRRRLAVDPVSARGRRLRLDVSVPCRRSSTASDVTGLKGDMQRFFTKLMKSNF